MVGKNVSLATDEHDLPIFVLFRHKFTTFKLGQRLTDEIHLLTNKLDVCSTLFDWGPSSFMAVARRQDSRPMRRD